MENDPGLFTDGTGDGMAGEMDVALATQQGLGTIYNGSTACKGCGMILDPVKSLQTELCASCNRRRMDKLVKGRMA